MQSYDPNAGLDFSQPIPDENKKGPPTGLLSDPADLNPENKIDESQMAEFSTAIEEVMAGPGQMMQDEVMGPPMMMKSGNKPTQRSSDGGAKSSKNPFGLTDEQFQAALAGIAAVAAYSKPVQDKLSTMVPKFLGENGEMSVTGMVVTALVAAILFYFVKKFLDERS
jgi:hypothetical protein